MHTLFYNFLIRTTLSIIVLGHAYAADNNQAKTFEENYKTFITFLPQEVQPKAEVRTAQEAFNSMRDSIYKLDDSGIFHSHIKQGIAYGRSFVTKNAPPLDFVITLLTGKHKWKKEVIESGTPIITIADIGAGIGLSAMHFVSKCIKCYGSEGWKLTQPIELDLFDLKEENVKALVALCNVVNATYPQYFRLRAFQQDIQAPFSQQNHYRISFLLNVLHYIRSDKWGHVLPNLRNTMQENGMLFLTTDHYNQLTIGRPSFVDTFRTLSNHFPFFCPTILLFCADEPIAKATILINYAGQNIFKDPKGHTPGQRYGKNEVSLPDFSKFIDVAVQGLHGKGIPLQEGDNKTEHTKADIMKKLQDDKLTISTGAYAFDNETLQKCIFASLNSNSPGFKALNFSWVYDVYLQLNTAGITLLATK